MISTTFFIGLITIISVSLLKIIKAVAKIIQVKIVVVN